MADVSLQEAIRNLLIADVFPRNLKVTVREDFDQKYDESPVSVQFRHNLTQISKLEMTVEQAGSSDKIPVVRFTFETGLRFVSKPPEADGEVEDSMVCAEVIADIVAEYRLRGDVDEESLQEFGSRNALYHVWPYWREVVQSMAVRFRLPPFPLPMYQIPTNSDSHEISDDGADDDSGKNPAR